MDSQIGCETFGPIGTVETVESRGSWDRCGPAGAYMWASWGIVADSELVTEGVW